MDSIISTKNLTFFYPEEVIDNKIKNAEILKMPILNNINLKIYEHEFVAILGHNGCGKSTLSKHFNAILQPSSGIVEVFKVPTFNLEKIFYIRQNVGMVFQNPDNQLVATIVEEDVAFALENLGVSPHEMNNRIDDCLKLVDMYDYKYHDVNKLSGGQKQKIAIAGVIAMNPQAIIFDESTAMLDPKGRQEIINTIKVLNKRYGTTIILITHYMDEAAQADRVVVMEKGDIILDDCPKKVFYNIEKLREVKLDVPQTTELVYRLHQSGIEVDTNILTVDECVNQLEKILSKA